MARMTGNSKATIQYLNLPDGQKTTFTIDFINKFRYVHFITDHTGRKRKYRCAPHSCSYCNNGDNRCLRLSMSVIHNGDKKILEVDSVLGHQIVNTFSAGDSLTIERNGTGFGTTYNIIGANVNISTSKTALTFTSDDEREEGIKELMYDLQRTNDYEEKYDLIKDFARKF